MKWLRLSIKNVLVSVFTVSFVRSYLDSKLGDVSYYNLVPILSRRQYHIVLTASGEKMYSVVGEIAERQQYEE